MWLSGRKFNRRWSVMGPNASIVVQAFEARLPCVTAARPSVHRWCPTYRESLPATTSRDSLRAIFPIAVPSATLPLAPNNRRKLSTANEPAIPSHGSKLKHCIPGGSSAASGASLAAWCRPEMIATRQPQCRSCQATICGPASVGLNWHMNAAGQLDGQVGDNPFIPVLANERHAVARLHAERYHRSGQPPHVCRHVVPREPVELAPPTAALALPLRPPAGFAGLGVNHQAIEAVIRPFWSLSNVFGRRSPWFPRVECGGSPPHPFMTTPRRRPKNVRERAFGPAGF